MAAKYSKIKGKLLKQDDITSYIIKDRQITQQDLALGTFTGEIFADLSIPASKLSNDVTKLGNLTNVPNGLVKLNEQGFVPPGLLKFNIQDLQSIGIKINVPEGLLQLNSLGKIDSSFIDIHDLLYKKIDSSYLQDSDILVKYNAEQGISGNYSQFKKMYIIEDIEPEIEPNQAVLFYNETDKKIYFKTSYGLYPIQNLVYVSSEVPQGDIDEVNMRYTLQHSPIIGSERVYINGIRVANDKYSINGNELVFVEPPFIGAEITVDYVYIGG